MSIPPSSNPSLLIPVRGQSPLLTWQELPKRWPSDSKSRLESNGRNLIWFEPNKNLLILLSRCYHNCLRTKRSRRPRLLPRSPTANRRKGKARPLRTWRMKSIPTMSHPSLHLKRRITQRMVAHISKGWANWSNVLRPSLTETDPKKRG